MHYNAYKFITLCFLNSVINIWQDNFIVLIALYNALHKALSKVLPFVIFKLVDF